MSDDAGPGSHDPSCEADDHSELLSTLDAHDLAVSVTPDEATDGDGFDFDATADPTEVFPQSVASGGPTPTGVILWTRLAPAASTAARWASRSPPTRTSGASYTAVSSPTTSEFVPTITL